MDRIFISRALKENSIFRIRLEKMGADVVGQSLIEFHALDFGPVPACDWIFFYSGKAVRFFFEGLKEQLPDVQWAALGQGTAKALIKQGLTPDFIGSAPPEGVAEAFAVEASGQCVLFPQARQSRQSVQEALKGRIRAMSLIVYDNRPRRVFDIPRCRILVFTSPMNAEAYFGKYSLQEGQLVVAIGETTAATLRQQGINNVRIAAEPSEASLAAAVAVLLQASH